MKNGRCCVMNRLKGAFEEEFQELKHSEGKVRQRVLNAVEHKSAKKSKLPIWMTSIAAILVIGLAGILATQFVQPKPQAALTLDETYYNLLVYENYELSNFFLTKPEVKKLAYETYIQNVALIEYAKSLDIPFDEEKFELHFDNNEQVISEIMTEQPDSWLHYRFDKIEEKFGVTLEKYKFIEKENVIRAVVSRDMLIDALGEEIAESNEPATQFVDDRALAYLEEHYSEELEAFRVRNDIDLTYEVNRKGQSTTLILGDAVYETVLIDGDEVFKSTIDVLDEFLFQFKNLIAVIEQREGLTLFCYEALGDYKRGAEKLLEDKEYAEEAGEFLKLLKVLENSVEID